MTERSKKSAQRAFSCCTAARRASSAAILLSGEASAAEGRGVLSSVIACRQREGWNWKSAQRSPRRMAYDSLMTPLPRAGKARFEKRTGKKHLREVGDGYAMPRVLLRSEAVSPRTTPLNYFQTRLSCGQARFITCISFAHFRAAYINDWTQPEKSCKNS